MFTGLYLSWEAFAPISRNVNLIKCLTFRALKVCSDKIKANLNWFKIYFWVMAILRKSINASKTNVMPSLGAIDTGRGQSGRRAVFCLSRLNNNSVGARCCWGGTPYMNCKVHIRASQAVTMGATRDIHGYEGAHLSSHCPDDPPLWLRNVATLSDWPTKAWSIR